MTPDYSCATTYERIRQLRTQLGLSQDDLAKLMGYSDRSMIAKIESGKVDISYKKILDFARILNTTPGFLMGIIASNDEPRTSVHNMNKLTPDYDRAATAAAEVLTKYGISTAPVDPIPIFKKADGFNVVTFTEMSRLIGVDRRDLLSSFDASNRDAVASVYIKNGKKHYLVAYNMRLPLYLVQRSLAREMGHIVLGHDGTRPQEVRNAEALCFAHHLLCPRALIRSLQDAGIMITTEVLGNTTGCYERCLIGMRQEPATHVPAALNRQIRQQFADYVAEFMVFQSFLSQGDDSMIANFGTYMDGYEE